RLNPGQDLKTLGANWFEIVFFQPRWGIAKRPFAKNALRGLLQEARIDVCAQDGHVPLARVRQDAIEQNRDGIRLLSRTTPRAPNSQPPFSPLPDAQQLRQEALAKD